MGTSINKRTFAGIIRRLFAFIIDLIILNIVFLALYIILFFIKYTYIDYWIMFAIIFLLYFTFGDSCIYDGQTPGKKRINIQLVDYQGKPIDAIKSMFRAIIITLIYFGFNIINIFIEFLSNYLQTFWVDIIITTIYSILFTGITVYAAFHPFKQTLQDSLIKTIVIIKGNYEENIFEVDNKMAKFFSSYFFSIVVIIFCIISAIIIKLLT